MNYLKLYNQLMDKRLATPSKAEYTETHHVLPRCMGGEDNPENLVVLSSKEHYVAHHLLYKHYKTTKLAHAWFMMLRCGSGQQREFNARQHEAATIAHSKALKETMGGDGNPFYGRTHSQETKDKISRANKGRVKSKTEIQNWVDKVASKPKTKEHKRKIGRKDMLMLQNVNTLEVVRVPKDDWRSCNEEWVNPKVITPEEKYKCSHCEVVTTKGNLKRWHDDNCKKRPRSV